jgi:hypothetical protein
MTKKTGKKRSPFDFPFQFALKINGYIICQRGFYVRDFNEDVYLSYELKEMMERIVGMGDTPDQTMGLIPRHLKAQSEDYLWSRYNPYYAYSDNATKPRQAIRKDYFTFAITAGETQISESKFENKFMLYSLDNQVDITEIVPDIIKDIEYTFSLDEYTQHYLNTDLASKSAIWEYGESLKG